MNIVRQMLVSAWAFTKLVFGDKLHRKKDRLGRIYHLKDYGEYQIFRETISVPDAKDRRVVLIVGFRLKLLGNNSLLHKVFQKACVLTTPFWSGYAGFKTKLWMVQRTTHNYLGIYDWVGEDNAREYADWLTKILRPLSVKDTVWYKIEATDFEKYLEEREYKLP